MFDLQVVEHNLTDLDESFTTATFGPQSITYMSSNGIVKIAEHWELKSKEVIDSDDNTVTVKFVFFDKKYILARIAKEKYKKYILLNSSSKSNERNDIDFKKVKFIILDNISIKSLFWIGLLTIAIIGMFSAEPSKNLTVVDKTKICKSYIGELFYKPINSISNRGYTNGFVVVEYTRSSDSSTWSYMCDISGDKMVWAAWLSDSAEWGRWRFEDEVVLNFDKATNTMIFVMPSTGSNVRVKL